MTKSVGDIAWDFGGWWVALGNGHGIRDADVSGLGHPKPDRQALLRYVHTWTFRCQSLLPATPLLRREVVPVAARLRKPPHAVRAFLLRNRSGQHEVVAR